MLRTIHISLLGSSLPLLFLVSDAKQRHTTDDVPSNGSVQPSSPDLLGGAKATGAISPVRFAKQPGHAAMANSTAARVKNPLAAVGKPSATVRSIDHGARHLVRIGRGRAPDGKALIEQNRNVSIPNGTASGTAYRCLTRVVSGQAVEADVWVAIVMVAACAVLAFSIIFAAQEYTPPTPRFQGRGGRFQNTPHVSPRPPPSKPGTPLVSSYDTLPGGRPSQAGQPLALPPPRPSMNSAGTPSPGHTGPRPSLQSASPAPNVLPPLCPALLMPHCEIWLGVGYEQLVQGEGTSGILGMSGTPLLYATVGNGGPAGGRSVCIALTPSRIPLLATISAPAVDPRGGVPAPEIRGDSGQKYGVVTPTSKGQYSLICEGTPMIYLNFDNKSGRLLLYSAVDSALVAHASRCSKSDYFTAGEHLEIRASPGVDAVLILCCVLSVLLFSGGVQLPAISPMASQISLR